MCNTVSGGRIGEDIVQSAKYTCVVIYSRNSAHRKDTTTDRRTACKVSLISGRRMFHCALFRGTLLTRHVADVLGNEFKRNRNRFFKLVDAICEV
jgi:hypothetical protein